MNLRYLLEKVKRVLALGDRAFRKVGDRAFSCRTGPIPLRKCLIPGKGGDTMPGRKMMRISTKGRYALRIMLDLARNGRGGSISLKEIGARQGIPVKYLETIMAVLLRAGFVTSVRGKGGGYRLACSPSSCTAGRVLKLAEGGLAPVACLAEEINSCPRASRCETLPLWQGLDRAVNSYLESVTLEDLLEGRLSSGSADGNQARPPADQGSKPVQE